MLRSVIKQRKREGKQIGNRWRNNKNVSEILHGSDGSLCRICEIGLAVSNEKPCF